MKFDKPISLTLTEVELIAATRAALGLGVGLLVAHRFSATQRWRLGRALAIIGAVSTVPLVIDVYAKLGAFGKQSEDTSYMRRLGRQRQWAEQSSGIW